MRRMVSIFAVVVLMASNANAATHVWLSPIGEPDGTVTVGNQHDVHDSVGGSGELNVWIKPQPGEVYVTGGLSFNLTSATPGVIDFAAVTVYNPEIEIEPPPFFGPPTAVRWVCVVDSTTQNSSECGSGSNPEPLLDLSGPDDDEIHPFGGFATLSQANVLLGLGVEAAKEIDPLYDPVADAWLFATVEYDVLSEGTTELFLQIGANGIAGSSNPSSDVNVIFGDGSDPPLNAEEDRRGEECHC